MKKRYKIYTSKHPRCKSEFALSLDGKLIPIVFDSFSGFLNDNAIQEICFRQFQWSYNIEATDEELEDILCYNPANW